MNTSPSGRFLLQAAPCALLIVLCTSCMKHVTSLPAGPITVSGKVSDATGLPLPNDKVRLLREHRYLETTTDATGGYAFPSLAAASYFLLPRLHHCHFLPPDADLDNLSSSVTEDFGGFGPACGGEPMVNMGANSGPLTISGHVRDASGNSVLGARIDLGEHPRAIRFTDFTGSYTFHVKPGDHDLRASGTCTFTPVKVDEDDMKVNVVHDFTAGPGCVTITATQGNLNPTGSVMTIRKGSEVLGTTYVQIEARSGPADAITRLNEIAAEQTTPSRSLTIAGSPSIERQVLVNLPGLDPDIEGGTGQASPFLALTTAIADGSTVVRFESQLAGTADAATIALFFQAGRNFTPAAIPGLHGPARTPVPMTHNTPASSPTAPGITAAGVVAPGAFGELEVTASDTANVVVYGTQNGPFLSTDGGQTVNAATYNTAAAPPSAAFNSKGDPTVTVGSPDATFHQTIYFAQLEQAVAPAPPNNPTPVIAVALYSSPDNGATFNSISFPVNCSVAATGCVVPDQEHLIADRINRAVTPTGAFDQLYLVWRNYTSQTSNAHTIAVACSQDGGLNWNSDLTTLNSTSVDFPRISVGPDGSFLVAYAVYSSFPTTYALNVRKWSSCASGFTPGKQVQVVKTVTEVTDMPGVDRQVQGNYSPAFDDSDGSAQKIFLAYANEPSAGNDDVHVAESRDGGATWPLDSIVNTVATGQRYFPWVCSTVGKKFVTWYDRRNSSAANPDLTAYYRSSVSDNGTPSTVGIGTESNVSGVDDPQCASGFPSSVRGAIEETGCKNLPAGFIQGGTCQATCAAGAAPPCGSLAACDFRASPRCANPTETCQPGGGQPKYGDYNGSACALGTLFTAWASATPPKGVGCLVNGLPSASAAKCCSGTVVGGSCAPSAASCVQNGGACGGGLTCCSASLNGRCQAGQCAPAISMYTGSSCVGLGCAGVPVTITYHQTGACNGYVDGSGGHDIGPKAAYVFFGIEEIDNSLGSTSFAFDPGNLFVQQASQRFLDSSLSVYAGIFGPFAIQASTLTPGQDLPFAPVAQGALVVTTTASDGASEANQTPYFLHYNRQPSDPQINLVKSDASRTSWPSTPDCLAITLK
jgi:hypothetical protein